MANEVSDLFEPLISRDVAEIRDAVTLFRARHSATELLDAITRFALLAFNPSQHGKHALLACLAVRDLAADLTEDRFDELIVECAIYAANSRLPWSEPPLDPPPSSDSDADAHPEVLTRAITEGDRMLAERWLLANMEKDDFSRTFFTSAAGNLSDYGHGLIMATAAWRLSQEFGTKHRFACLRAVAVEWTSHQPESGERGGRGVDAGIVLRGMLRRFLEDPSAEVFHAFELYDAALQAADLSGSSEIELKVREYLSATFTEDSEPAEQSFLTTGEPASEPVPYDFESDYAQLLLSNTISRRLARRFPDFEFSSLVSGSERNLVSVSAEALA